MATGLGIPPQLGAGFVEAVQFQMTMKARGTAPTPGVTEPIGHQLPERPSGRNFFEADIPAHQLHQPIQDPASVTLKINLFVYVLPTV